MEEKCKAIVHNSHQKAKSEIDLSRPNEDKEAVMLMLELGQLSHYNAELHHSCESVMKNFRIRQNACDKEISLATRRLRPEAGQGDPVSCRLG